VRFRPRSPTLDPFSRASVARWEAQPDASLGPGLTRDQRASLAGLLVEVWEMEHPSASFVDDPSDLAVIEHLPDFVPAPSYVWGRAHHPESDVLFEWTLADPHAEPEATAPIDVWAPWPCVDVEAHEDRVVLTLDDGAGESALVEIHAHAIVLFGTDDDAPLCLIRAIQAFTGWSAPRPSYWYDPETPVYTVAELAPCRRCGEVREVGFPDETCCEACGAAEVGLEAQA
jgi:hypothetical protein